jgi:predicted nucleic acid-binding protein
MSGLSFLDTNILVYAYDPSDPHKQNISKDLVRGAFLGRNMISAQVLAEFVSTLLHKIAVRRTAAEIAAMPDILSPIKLVIPDADMIRRAVEVHAAYGIHFYDGMIVAAAERAGCENILSEDLNSGQEYFGLAVANPF